MPRITLQQQWGSLMGELNAKKVAFVDSVLPMHQCPLLVYSLESYKTISEYVIDGVTVQISTPYTDRRITGKAVAELHDIVLNFNPSIDDIRLKYHYQNGVGRVSGSLSISDLGKDRYSTVREDLLPKQQELIEKYAPREGYEACAYCGTQNPEGEMKSHTIFARQYPNGRMTALYCDGGCGMKNQMAHEG